VPARRPAPTGRPAGRSPDQAERTREVGQAAERAMKLMGEDSGVSRNIAAGYGVISMRGRVR